MSKVFNTDRNFKQIGKEEIKESRFSAYVHTFEIASPDALLPEDEIMAKPYIKSFRFQKCQAIYLINPNKYNGNLYTLDDFETVFQSILKELFIDEFCFRRVDIAVDTDLAFENCYKLNSYLAKLWDYKIESNNLCKNRNGCIKTSIYCYHRNYVLAIYDKKIESAGRSHANTRIEFRFVRIRKSCNVNDIFRDLGITLNSLHYFNDKANEDCIRLLQEQYLIEQAKEYESRSLCFSDFINKWVYDIYNWNILSGLFALNCSGRCKEWHYRHRKKGFQLTLYNKSEIEAYIKRIDNALENYVKSTDIVTLKNN